MRATPFTRRQVCEGPSREPLLAAGHEPLPFQDAAAATATAAAAVELGSPGQSGGAATGAGPLSLRQPELYATW